MEEKKNNSEDIISKHVIFAMTAGAIPVPVADIVAVSAIQYDMIRQLAAFYNVNYDADKGKTLASSLAGATVSRIGASALKAIPGVGTLLGIGSQVVMAGATTYALGKLFDSYFSGGKGLDNINLDSAKKQYNDLLSKGKEYVKDLKKSFSKDDVFQTIEKLSQLKDNGAITEEEFLRTKEKLLSKIV
jgi:uncharacterized protein (DUF697 family)